MENQGTGSGTRNELTCSLAPRRWKRPWGIFHRGGLRAPKTRRNLGRFAQIHRFTWGPESRPSHLTLANLELSRRKSIYLHDSSFAQPVCSSHSGAFAPVCRRHLRVPGSGIFVLFCRSAPRESRHSSRPPPNPGRQESCRTGVVGDRFLRGTGEAIYYFSIFQNLLAQTFKQSALKTHVPEPRDIKCRTMDDCQ
jgi:hypothetical protein